MSQSTACPEPASTLGGDGSTLRDLLRLAWLFGAMLALSSPVGEFPLNDDWSYTRTTKLLAEEGVFRPLGWTSTPLLSQALWGAAFIRVFGFSFQVLRASTALLALASAGVLYCLAHRLSGNRRAAFICAALLLLNPIFFGLSVTFMTDVPFLAFALGSLLCLVRALEDGRRGYLVAGTLLSLAATLTRQLGLCVPLAFLVVRPASGGSLPRRLVEAATPAAVSLVVLLAFERWLSAQGLPEVYRHNVDDLRTALSSPWQSLVGQTLDRAANFLLYLGLFLLPLIGSTSWRKFAAASSRRLQWAAAASLVAGALCVRLLWTKHGVFPLIPNIFWNLGVGPALLIDLLAGTAPLPAAPLVLWKGVGILATLGAMAFSGWMAWVTAEAIHPSTASSALRRPDLLLVLGAGMVYAAPLLPGTIVFDRYLLPLLAIGAAALAAATAGSPRPGRYQLGISSGFLLLLGSISVAGTHDYFAWNRARWAALRSLVVERNIEPSRIDGGFEFSGWELYEPSFVPRPGRASWWIHDDEWRVTFGTMPGYQVESRWLYYRLLPPGQAQILVLRRASSAPSDP